MLRNQDDGESIEAPFVLSYFTKFQECLMQTKVRVILDSPRNFFQIRWNVMENFWSLVLMTCRYIGLATVVTWYI